MYGKMLIECTLILLFANALSSFDMHCFSGENF